MTKIKGLLFGLIAVLLMSLAACDTATAPSNVELDTQARDCVRSLQPDERYDISVSTRTSDYNDVFETNGNGYPKRVSFLVNPNRASLTGKRPRGEVQCSTASVGKFGGGQYQGGHMVADRFKGLQARVNLFPQIATYNTGSFRAIEGAIANRAKVLNNKDIEVDIDLKYGGNNIVPYGMNITLFILDASDGEILSKKNWFYTNQPPNKRSRTGETNEDYNRGVKDSIKTWLNSNPNPEDL